MSEGYAKNEIGKSLESFEDTATAYMNEKLDTLESVMKAVVFMVATQLSKQPEVRKGFINYKLFERGRGIFPKRIIIN